MFLFEEEKIRLYRGVKVLLHQLQTLSPILYTFSAGHFLWHCQNSCMASMSDNRPLYEFFIFYS